MIDKLPGGDYTAIQNKDGTWNIKDVPIFAEHKNPRINKTIDEKWLKQAIDRAYERYNSGYLAPLHYRHHLNSSGNEPIHAGYILPKRIVREKYDNKTVAVILADLLKVPDEIYQKIKQGKLPYRSVEIHNFDKPEISSLALLSHDVPFFKFPMLTIGEEIKRSKDAAVTYSIDLISEEPLIAWTAINNKGLLIFSFEGQNMKDEKNLTKLQKFEDNPDDNPEHIPDEEEERRKREEQMQQAPQAVSLEDVMKAIMSLAEKIDKLIAGDEEPIPEQQQENGPVETTNKVSKLAFNEGTIIGLDKRIKYFEEKERLTKLVEAAKVKLAVYNLDNIDAKLYELAQEGGEKALNAFIEGVQKTGIKDPPPAFTKFMEQYLHEPEEIRIYEALGPIAVEKAKQYCEAYSQVKDKLQNTTLMDFLRNNMEHEGFVLKK